MIENYKYKYMHNHINGCKDVAFYTNSEPLHGGVIEAQLSMFPDGEIPKPKDPYKCGSCGKEFNVIMLEHVKLNERYGDEKQK